MRQPLIRRLEAKPMIPATCKTLVLATGNAHKVCELSGLLSTLGIPLASLADWPATTPVEENGTTPAENARIKASGYARQLKQWVLADDTALCVDALDGAPGVRSARYAGAHATMAENRAQLLAELAQVPDALRTAQFVCHLVVANPAGDIVTEATGVCTGRIRREATTSSFGFGYDVLFEVAECNQTLAELSPEITSIVGHRGRAVRALLEAGG